VLRVDYGRWGQTAADLRWLALNTAHPRSRERFLALHDIAQGRCATDVAARTNRRPRTVMDWLHAYNDHGPEALVYRRTGGRPPFVRPSRPASVRQSVRPSSRRPRHP
jgi:transposase